MATDPALILRISLGLAILYGLVIVVWFELLRSGVARRMARRRRRDGAATTTSHPDGREEGEPVEHKSKVAEDRVAMESELERARMHYRLAREQARAERDAAIAAAKEAAEEAIERIERRYREIDGAFIDEETERILELLRGPWSEDAP